MDPGAIPPALQELSQVQKLGSSVCIMYPIILQYRLSAQLVL